MPISQGVTAVIDGTVTPEQLTVAMMSRARKHERG
jgi:glycerol-3-phosphate dehydrogenase (NAD(P)+)